MNRSSTSVQSYPANEHERKQMPRGMVAAAVEERSVLWAPPRLVRRFPPVPAKKGWPPFKEGLSGTSLSSCEAPGEATRSTTIP